MCTDSNAVAQIHIMNPLEPTSTSDNKLQIRKKKESCWYIGAA